MSEPDAVTVRAAHADDLGRAGELTVLAYAADGMAVVGEGYGIWLADAEHRAAHGDVLVATVGDAVVGTVTYVEHGSELAELAQPGDVEIRALAVDPEHRGRGIARALMAEVTGRARAAGRSGIVLSSAAEMHAAHRLYESLGFRRRTDLDWSPRPGIVLVAYDLVLDGRQ